MYIARATRALVRSFIIMDSHFHYQFHCHAFLSCVSSPPAHPCIVPARSRLMGTCHGSHETWQYSFLFHTDIFRDVRIDYASLLLFRTVYPILLLHRLWNKLKKGDKTLLYDKRSTRINKTGAQLQQIHMKIVKGYS